MQVAQIDHEHQQQLVRALNSCIEVCVDSEKAYSLAAADVLDADLKKLFMSRVQQRARFVQELQLAIGKLGAAPENQGSAGGMLRLGWAGLQKALGGKDERMIANQCQRGELHALESYKTALLHGARDSVSADLRAMLQTQCAAVQATVAELRHRYP